MWRVLKDIGMPEPLINALQCFYVANRHIIKVKGEHLLSFTAFSGIRQGCPLSPLLFALAVDIFLRRFQKSFPLATIRAFADDIAMVTDNVLRDADQIMNLFADFGSVSGLELGVSKTIVVPLWNVSKRELSHSLQSANSHWQGVAIRMFGKYLGFMIGPGKGQ